MTIDILKELGSRSGVLDRRFLIGVFFPNFIGIILLYMLLFEEIPKDVFIWTDLIIISLSYSFIFNEFTPKICWIGSFTSYKYQVYLNENFGKVFIEQAEDKLVEYTVDRTIYTNLIKKEIPNFKKEAQQDYLSSYFLANQRYNHEELILDEARFLLIISIILIIGINLLAVICFSELSIKLSFFSIEKISGDLSFILGINYILIISFSLYFLYKQIGYFWRSIIKSTNVPYKEDERIQVIRQEGINIIKNFTFNNNDNNIEQVQTPVFAKSLENLSLNFIKDEVYFRIRTNLLQDYFNIFFKKHLSELKINTVQADKLSERLSKTIPNANIKFLANEDFFKSYSDLKQQIQGAVSSYRSGSLIIDTGLIVSTGSLLEFVLEQITGQTMYHRQLNSLVSELETNYELKDLKYLEALNEFRKIRNYYAHKRLRELQPLEGNLTDKINNLLNITDKLVQYKTKDILVTSGSKAEESVNVEPKSKFSINIPLILAIIFYCFSLILLYISNYFQQLFNIQIIGISVPNVFIVIFLLIPLGILFVRAKEIID